MKSSFINVNKHYITEKTKRNKNINEEEIYNKSNNYFILTDGGLPIYTRYSDELKISSFISTLSAIIHKFNLSVNEKNKEELK